MQVAPNPQFDAVLASPLTYIPRLEAWATPDFAVALRRSFHLANVITNIVKLRPLLIFNHL